jgi:hypothetical protein
MRLLAILALLLAPAQQTREPQQTRDLQQTRDPLTLNGAKPLIDNDRVTVWDFTWTRGVPEALERRTSNSVWISVSPSAGEVRFWPKGTERQAPQSSSMPVRTIVIDLKDFPVRPLKNTSGFPNAFPRPGNKKILENDRVIVWDYTWTPGQPTPMHFHDKDVVVVYLKDGLLKSTTLDGQSVVNTLSAGLTKFNVRDRTHTETLVEGASRAIITELK